MMISLQRLWMGTGNGVVISVPLSEGSSTKPIIVKDILSSLNQTDSNAEADDEKQRTAVVTPVYRLEWPFQSLRFSIIGFFFPLEHKFFICPCF